MTPDFTGGFPGDDCGGPLDFPDRLDSLSVFIAFCGTDFEADIKSWADLDDSRCWLEYFDFILWFCWIIYSRLSFSFLDSWFWSRDIVLRSLVLSPCDGLYRFSSASASLGASRAVIRAWVLLYLLSLDWVHWADLYALRRPRSPCFFESFPGASWSWFFTISDSVYCEAMACLVFKFSFFYSDGLADPEVFEPLGAWPIMPMPTLTWSMPSCNCLIFCWSIGKIWLKFYDGVWFCSSAIVPF